MTASIPKHGINHTNHGCSLLQVGQKRKSRPIFRWRFDNKRGRKYTYCDIMGNGIWSKFKESFLLPKYWNPQQMYYKGIMMVTIYKCGGQNISPIPLQMKMTHQDETRSNKKQTNPFKWHGFCWYCYNVVWFCWGPNFILQIICHLQ